MIKEIKVKSIITTSGLADYVINPYVGCMHSCIYCYARFMKKFTGHAEKWGTFCDVKINAPELIKPTKKYIGKTIFLSSVTDPYNPLEKKYLLTRKILEKLIFLEPELEILTKNSLVLRDIDLFKRFKKCTVGMSLSLLDDNIRKEVEPVASSVQERIKTLKTLKENNIKTYVFLSPLFPYLSDYKGIINALKGTVDYFMFENLSMKPYIIKDILDWIKNKHPDLLEKYRELTFSKEAYFGYWNKIEEEIRKIGKRERLEFRIYFHH